MRLDDSETGHRKTEVFRLKNSYADKVAESINKFLSTERQIQMQQTPGMISAFEQIDREVVVVPELVSNSLILSAMLRFFGEVKSIIEQLDARPPMVMIQVLIAQIELDNTDQFGVELGLQDGLAVRSQHPRQHREQHDDDDKLKPDHDANPDHRRSRQYAGLQF